MGEVKSYLRPQTWGYSDNDCWQSNLKQPREKNAHKSTQANHKSKDKLPVLDHFRFRLPKQKV